MLEVWRSQGHQAKRCKDGRRGNKGPGACIVTPHLLHFCACCTSWVRPPIKLKNSKRTQVRASIHLLLAENLLIL
eukprot:1154197-Pelagomonas_calceolata.AAC.5